MNRTEQIFELPGLKGALDTAKDDEAKVLVTSGAEARPTSGKARSAMAESIPRVLHSFSKPDGAHPQAGLIDVDGTLYGTTNEGGTYGYGTVLALKP